MACWQWFLGFIVNVIIIGIALWPIWKEYLHKRKYRYILRQQILRELGDIKRSYEGKIETYPKKYPKSVPPYDISCFNTLTELFEKSTYLSKKERKRIAELLSEFRKGAYERQKEERLIAKKSIYKIKEISEDATGIIKSRLGIEEKNNKQIGN